MCDVWAWYFSEAQALLEKESNLKWQTADAAILAAACCLAPASACNAAMLVGNLQDRRLPCDACTCWAIV